MSTEWYAKQFGDRDRFAVAISIGRDPHPLGDPEIDESWGGLALWARGRCLTRSVSGEGAVSDEVRWSLASILRWLIDVAVRLVNEEPFPGTTRQERIADACAWLNASETPLLTLTEAEEDDWFLRRSEWRQHHALRRAAVDVALPNLVIRRLGDFLELSWDNQTWGAARPDLSFVEQRGVALVSAQQAARDLREAIVDVTQALAERRACFADLADAARSLALAEADWKWLVHPGTAAVIREEMEDLRERLEDHVRAVRSGVYIPHTPETLLLRQAKLASQSEIQALLEIASPLAHEPMDDTIRKLVRPAPASSTEPWREGYEQAHALRDEMGWGDDPIPDLAEWIRSNSVGLSQHHLAPTIDLIMARTDHHGSLTLNPDARSPLRREIGVAAALGHLLFDPNSQVVGGTWEHWPTAARARAFAVMLLLPDAGVRDVLSGCRKVDASDVKRVMDRFRTGPYATAYHLEHRGFIEGENRRAEILHELVA